MISPAVKSTIPPNTTTSIFFSRLTSYSVSFQHRSLRIPIVHSPGPNRLCGFRQSQYSRQQAGHVQEEGPERVAPAIKPPAYPPLPGRGGPGCPHGLVGPSWTSHQHDYRPAGGGRGFRASRYPAPPAPRPPVRASPRSEVGSLSTDWPRAGPKTPPSRRGSPRGSSEWFGQAPMARAGHE